MTPSFESRPDPAVALLRDIAGTPRPTGSDALAAARARVGAELRGLGFAVREEAFGFSAWPGRFATPAVGLGIAVLGATTGHLGARVGGGSALVVLVLGLLVLGQATRWLLRSGVIAMPLARSVGVNLVATRGRAPRVWLCAHLDSKSQPVPSLVRMAGIALAAAGLMLLAALGALDVAGAGAPFGWWGAATVVTLIGCVPVVMSVTGSSSPGALDNASGVAAVIDAARRLSHDDPVGVLITDAEELGLAGAHAWARANTGAVVLNCDGVDDAGADVVMHAGRAPTALQDAARAAAGGQTLVVRRMPLGLLTDSVAFSLHGCPSVTFSRGSFASLSRVHRPGDSLERLSGSGIAGVSALMAASARELLRT